MILYSNISGKIKNLLPVILLFVCCQQGLWAQQKPTTLARTIDSLNALLKSDKEDTSKISHLNSLCRAYYGFGNIQQALNSGNTAIKLATSLSNQTYLIKAYVNTASVHYYTGNYPEALQFFFKALTLSDAQKDFDGQAAAFAGIGNVYKDQRNYPQALEYYFKALNINTQKNRKKGMSVCYGNIGVVYWNMSDYTQALSYYLKAFQLDEELNDKNGIAADLTNIGNIYAQKGDTAQAIENYKKALSNYQSAGNQPGIAVVTGNIGELYMLQKNYKEAGTYIQNALMLSRSINNLEAVKHQYKVLSRFYALTGDWQKAYQFHVQYSYINDTLLNRDNTKKIVQAEMNYEFEKKQATQKAEEDKKDAIRAAESKTQKTLLWLIGAIAVIIALIALFIFRLLKATQREKLIAEQQKSLMELKALRAQMNPHFIFNAINSIQHFILKNDSDAAQKHLNKFSKLIRKVLENSKQESIPLSEEIQMLQLYTELESVRFSSKFHYKFIVNEKLNPESIMVPPLIIQPFIENAIWHGLMHLKDRQGELMVTFDKKGDMLHCTVDDNGIGRKRSKELRDEARHEPMGLSITHERIEILNEVYHTDISIQVTDKINTNGNATGTTVELLVPLNLTKTTYA